MRQVVIIDGDRNVPELWNVSSRGDMYVEGGSAKQFARWARSASADDLAEQIHYSRHDADETAILEAERSRRASTSG